ncbi:hypothetical protein V3W47_18925 [Deinococcus sp. YIM 134068]|uniref:hypothetical protein n=1 Tax=Deinococcus lichenicola TaxID=3118910 RepID=UPI002F940BC5
MRLPHITAEQTAKEAARRQLLDRQRAALLRGESPPQSAPRPEQPGTAQPVLMPMSRVDSLRLFWPLRKSVKARPVRAFYRPPTLAAPVTFGYHRMGGVLPELRRAGVSREWQRLLSSVSAAGCAGGRVLGNQGRNLSRIVEGLRSRCYLRVSDSGRPLSAREQVVLVVESKGESGESFARDLGMSPSTFYEALRHPLAYLWIRTQKVQQTDLDGARRNVATCFTVALYDPPLPGDLETACYAEPVEESGVFVVPVCISEDDRTKKNPTPLTKNEEACGKLPARPGGAENPVQEWENAAAMPDRGVPESHDGGKDVARELLHVVRPDLWELAGHMAVQLGEREPRAARFVYYRALLWLGYQTVRKEYITVERHVSKGRDVRNQGALLVARLNRRARAKHGLNLRELPFSGPPTASTAEGVKA